MSVRWNIWYHYGSFTDFFGSTPNTRQFILNRLTSYSWRTFSRLHWHSLDLAVMESDNLNEGAANCVQARYVESFWAIVFCTYNYEEIVVRLTSSSLLNPSNLNSVNGSWTRNKLIFALPCWNSWENLIRRKYWAAHLAFPRQAVLVRGSCQNR